jgi:hypothetical protein
LRVDVDNEFAIVFRKSRVCLVKERVSTRKIALSSLKRTERLRTLALRTRDVGGGESVKRVQGHEPRHARPLRRGNRSQRGAK